MSQGTAAKPTLNFVQAGEHNSLQDISHGGAITVRNEIVSSHNLIEEKKKSESISSHLPVERVSLWLREVSYLCSSALKPTRASLLLKKSPTIH